MENLLSTLNWVDVIIIVAFLFGAYKGYKAGLLKELLRFFIMFLSFFSAYAYGPEAGEFLSSRVVFIDEELGGVLAGIGLMLAVGLVLSMVAWLIKKIVSAPEGGLFGLLGMGVGVLSIAFLLSSFLMALDYVGLTALYEDAAGEAALAPRIIPAAPTAFEYLAGVLPEWRP